MKGRRLLSSAGMRDAVTLCDGPNIASDFTGFFQCPISKDSATLLRPYAVRMVECVIGFHEVFLQKKPQLEKFTCKLLYSTVH